MILIPLQCRTMTRLLLVRHGETEWNRDERFIGSSDVPLSEQGTKQAEALAGRLAGESIAAVYSSGMMRALETASIIARIHDLAPIVDPRLREVSYGEWEGHTAEEVEDRTGVHFPSRFENPQVPFPRDDSVPILLGDVEDFLKGILAEHPDETIILVGHGVSFQMILFSLLDIPYRNHWLLYMYNASLSEVLVRDGKAVLVNLNDTGHL